MHWVFSSEAEQQLTVQLVDVCPVLLASEAPAIQTQWQVPVAWASAVCGMWKLSPPTPSSVSVHSGPEHSCVPVSHPALNELAQVRFPVNGGSCHLRGLGTHSCVLWHLKEEAPA